MQEILIFFCICYHYFLDVFLVIILCLACWRKWQLILTWNVSLYIESLCLWFMPNSENKRNKICKLCTILLAMNRLQYIYISATKRTNLSNLLDLLIFCIYSLNFSLKFFIMIFLVTNQLNISKFLPLQIRKTLISY